jgi:hypothetical protein
MLAVATVQNPDSNTRQIVTTIWQDQEILEKIPASTPNA